MYTMCSNYSHSHPPCLLAPLLPTPLLTFMSCCFVPQCFTLVLCVTMSLELPAEALWAHQWVHT